jgi:Lon protease-like protein
MTWCPSEPDLQAFSGRAPLFPLPGVVLFPHAVLPLHIFEPRYRQMTADALAGERLIAMSLLTPNWQASTSVSLPTIHPTVGLGRIIAHEHLEDGRYMLVLRGVARARVLQEPVVDRLYRIGELELCSDAVPAEPEFDRQIRAEEITSLFCKLFPGAEFQRLVQQAMSVDLPLGQVCDVIASALPIEPQLAQVFLDERNVDLRSQMLWQLLKQIERPEARTSVTTRRDPFPPSFSNN